MIIMIKLVILKFIKNVQLKHSNQASLNNAKGNLQTNLLGGKPFNALLLVQFGHLPPCFPKEL